MNRPNRLAPLSFIIAFGVVSMLGDFVYEGARSIVGPFLGELGASAFLVGLVTGAGEAVALVLRLFSGPLADHTRKYWAISIAGYAITLVAVPLLSLAGGLYQASALVMAERFGKAVRSPARDTMLAHAASAKTRGRMFALHEAMDQAGALVGPLVVAGAIAVAGHRTAFAILAVPALLALATLAWLRRQVPRPAAYDDEPSAPSPKGASAPALSKVFWYYAAFTACSMLGFSTFAIISFHMQDHHLIGSSLIPVSYALAMGTASLSALLSGHLYDRFGLHALIPSVPLTIVLPFLSFSLNPGLVWVGAAIWGLVGGIHESTMRAAVADLVPSFRRGAGYGIFTAIYGVAWMIGTAIIGALYAASTTAIVIFVAVTQVLSLLPLHLATRQG